MSEGNTRRRTGKPARGPRIAGDPRDPAGFHALLLAYLSHSEAAGFAPATLKNRRDAVNAFTDWCAERAITRPGEVTFAVLERYQRHVASHRRERDGRPLSHRGQIVRLGPLKGFFAYLAKRRHILYNPAAELELPRGERRLPRGVLTAAQAEAVLSKADPGEGLGLRDRAILEVLYSTGLRRGEVIRLAVDDLDHDRGTVLVRQGKHAKDRIVPIGDRALGWVERYLDELRPELRRLPDDGTVFLTQAGEALSGNRLSELVSGYLASAGHTGSCHLFRHTMATLMLEGGADIRYIQAMLGHADLATTEVYTRVGVTKLKAVHSDTHPGRLAGTRSGTEPQIAPETELFAALDAEADDVEGVSSL